MIRPLLALALFPSLAAYAQSGGAEQPIETASPVAIWIFAILFFGAIGVYVFMTLRSSKKAKHAKHAEPKNAETKRAETKRAERA
jgi:flagellar basal body-associated protein FliL